MKTAGEWEELADWEWVLLGCEPLPQIDLPSPVEKVRVYQINKDAGSPESSAGLINVLPTIGYHVKSSSTALRLAPIEREALVAWWKRGDLRYV